MTVSIKSHQEKEQEEGRSKGEMENEFCEFNTRALSRAQNELIGELELAAGDVISIGVGYEVGYRNILRN